MLSVTSHRSTSLVRCWHLGAGSGVTTGGGPDACQCRPEPAQPDDGVTSVQCSVSPCWGAVMVTWSQHYMWWWPLSGQAQWSSWWMAQKTREFGCQALICEATWGWPHVSWALLSVQARQVSPGQEPLTYIFTFLSSPGPQLSSSETIDSQKLGDRTQAYNTPPAMRHQTWDSEKWIMIILVFLRDPAFLSVMKQL